MAAYGALFIAGCVMVAFLLWLVNASRKLNQMYPDFARERGLVHRQEVRAGDPATFEDVLEGPLDGVPVRLHAIRESRGRVTTRQHLRVEGHAAGPAGPRFTIWLGSHGPGTRVTIGDPVIDGLSLLSDAPDACAVPLRAAPVRSAIARAAAALRAFELHYDRGVVTLEASVTPFAREELEAPLLLVVACCRAAAISA